MGVRFEKDPDYMFVFVPERRFTDTLMTRPDPKKTLRMSRKGHYQKVRRPTNLEVYNDAAKILEELLEKRMDLKAQNRQKRNKTDPNAEKVLNIVKEPENAVARSKTMPSKYREAPGVEIRKKEKIEYMLKMRGTLEEEAENALVSSADSESEGEENNPMQKRKKKSLFKLAKERLIRTFNRDQKDGIGKMKEKSESSNVKRRKPKKKADKESGEVVSERNRHIKAHLNKDNTIDYTEDVECRSKSGSFNTESHWRDSRSSSFSRKALMKSIRKPFRKFDRSEHNDIRNSKTVVEKADISRESSPSLPPVVPQPTSGGLQMSFSSNMGPPAPQPVRSPLPPLQGTSSPQRLVQNPSPSNSSPQDETHAVLDNRPSHSSGLSSSSSAFPQSDHHHSVGSLSGVSSVKSSILNNPGDDIKFIDAEGEVGDVIVQYGSNRSINSTGVKFHTSEGLLNFNWLADQTANRAMALDYQIDERSVSRLRPDGEMEMTTTLTATRTVIMPDVEEVDEFDNVDGDEIDKPVGKEELYGKIAQKLIAMADNYSANMSDPESAGAAAASSIEVPLTDLEKEIIACLRSKDKYSKEVEDKLKEVATASADNAYQRFRSTIQNSLGTELSWDHMAFLFYTTKGVVSALGKGSQAANQAKNFTLQYITDTCASWIMDQGGFDSMLSSSESDPEVD